MRLSPLVDRIAGRGAWSIHMEAALLRDQGQDVIFLTVGFLAVRAFGSKRRTCGEAGRRCDRRRHAKVRIEE